jgi:serine/threonine-protein kinase
MEITIGEMLVNRYRIVNRFGQGGMGTVYRAWDMNLRKAVALKENLDTSLPAKAQFEREANILANLSHPNLPRVTDHFFLEERGQYLVMDFVEGEDLESMVRRLGPLPVDQALNWTLQICSALDYLHHQASPIIHRDIKPANIKITPDGRAILVDFGIAKFYDPMRMTMAGAKAFTPGFSPLEQYQATTDIRSDIYSMGATLYTLLTGELLPESPLLATKKASLIPPRDLRPELSSALEVVILRAVEILPDQRYQQVREFSTALESSSINPVQSQSQDREKIVLQTITVSQPEEIAPALPAFSPEVAAAPKSNRSRVMITVAGFGLLALVGGFVITSLFLNGRSNVNTALVSSTMAPVNSISSNSMQTEIPSPTFVVNTPPVQQIQPNNLPANTLIPTSILPTVIQPTDTVSEPLGSAVLFLDQNYNCRGGQSSDYDIIWTFETGSELEIIGKSQAQWWLVRVDDPRTRRKQCWISGGQASGNLDAVPYSDWTGTVDTAKTPWPF